MHLIEGFKERTHFEYVVNDLLYIVLLVFSMRQLMMRYSGL